ncbi:MAG: radical SAM protein [Flavobacteriales bacterium]|nr:radical SAM protein [Flavobacteriales bacterium]
MPETVKLPVMEQFYTLQGEGYYAGQAAWFIRLGGCDVGCVWCDVKESWDADVHPLITVEELVKRASATPAEIVVITGGEPAMYDLSLLCNELRSAGKRVHIETSGAHPLLGVFDWVCFSPKKFKAPLSEVAALADELKVIVFNKSDFDWARTWEEEVPETCLLYIQPEWDKREVVEPMMIEFIKENPRWRMSIQTHKYLGID